MVSAEKAGRSRSAVRRASLIAGGAPLEWRAPSKSTTSRHLAFVEARHQLGEVAGPEADVELLAQNVVPAILAGAGRAGQREDVGGVGDARGGAALHGRGAD